MDRARRPRRNAPLNGEPLRADADAINQDTQVSNFGAQKECAKGKGAKVVRFAENVEFLNGNSSGVGVLESEDDDGAGKGRVWKRKALKGALKPKKNLLDGANRVAAARTIETRSRRRAQSLVDNGFDDAVGKGNFMDKEAAQDTQRCSIEFEADVDNNRENGGVRRKRRGRKRKTRKNEVSSGENAENDVLGANVELEMNGDYSGSSARGRKVNVQEKPKVNKRDPKWIEEESLMCHQCQRNDKGDVVRCTKCKRRRFCFQCLYKWYPQLKLDDAAGACPVCRGNCNCKACL